MVSLDIWYQSGKDSGILCSIGKRAESGLLSDRFQEQHGRYREYINQYREFLAQAKDSSEFKSLLGN